MTSAAIEWRPVPGLTDCEASATGEIRARGRTLRQRDNIAGYKRVYAQGRERLVHRLVAMAFLGSAPPDRQDVNHIDGNRHNNAPGNLEWSNHSLNAKHAIALGLFSPRTPRHVGVDVGSARLDDDRVREIRALAGRLPQRAIAKLFGVGQMTVSQVVRRVTWRHVA